MTRISQLPRVTGVNDESLFVVLENGVAKAVTFGFLRTETVGYTGSIGGRGLQGSPGYTGSRGIGFSGSQGPQGTPGIPGGYTGSQGFGFSGSATPGFMGSRGFIGSLGFTGSAGTNGFTGSATAGFVGSRGDVGFIGSQGPQGPAGGFTGSFGFAGSQGPAGSPGGYTGSGATGFTGSSAPGFTGSSSPGFTGSSGINGFTGSAIVGFTGSGGSGGGGVGLSARSTAAVTTTSLANNASVQTSLTGFKSYILYKVQTSAAAWVRIYTSASAQSSDASRTQGTDPAPGSGVIAEVITSGSTTQLISPGVIGFNDSLPVSTTVFITVTNLSGVTTPITVTLTINQLES